MTSAPWSSPVPSQHAALWTTAGVNHVGWGCKDPVNRTFLQKFSVARPENNSDTKTVSIYRWSFTKNLQFAFQACRRQRHFLNSMIQRSFCNASFRCTDVTVFAEFSKCDRFCFSFPNNVKIGLRFWWNFAVVLHVGKKPNSAFDRDWWYCFQ